MAFWPMLLLYGFFKCFFFCAEVLVTRQPRSGSIRCAQEIVIYGGGGNEIFICRGGRNGQIPFFS